MSKYCSVCNIRYRDDFDFCEECGSRLTSLSKKSGTEINMGDANAISGGLNISSNQNFDSHNVYNQTSNNVINQTRKELNDDISKELDLGSDLSKDIETDLSGVLNQIGNINSELGLNLGDANAISGGIHKIQNTNIDSHNIINKTNNISIHQEVPKTAAEIKAENEKKLRTVIRDAYEDGIITGEEELNIKKLIHDLGVEPNIAHKILLEEKSLAYRRMKGRNLTEVEYELIKIVQEEIRSNDKEGLTELVDDLEILNSQIENGEVQYYYYMLLASLQPEKFISAVENNTLKADNFWRTVWLLMAYRLTETRVPIDLETKFKNYILSEDKQFPGNIELAESMINLKEGIQSKVKFKRDLLINKSKEKYNTYLNNHQGWLEDLGNALGSFHNKSRCPDESYFYIEQFFKEIAEDLIRENQPDVFAPLEVIPQIPKIAIIKQ